MSEPNQIAVADIEQGATLPDLMQKHAKAGKAQHSPLPWSIREHQRPERETVTYEAGNTFGIYKTNNESVFWAVADEIENEADAKLIVRAVNNAEALANALRAILDWIDSGCDPSRKSIERANVALDEWEGKTP